MEELLLTTCLALQLSHRGAAYLEGPPPCPVSLLPRTCTLVLQTAGQHIRTEEHEHCFEQRLCGFPPSDEPHPAAGQWSTSHRTLACPYTSTSPLLLVFLAQIQLSMVLPKLLPRELVSVLARKALHPYDMTCWVNTGFPVPTEKALAYLSAFQPHSPAQ